MGKIASTIKEKLTQAFNPVHILVEDESHKHASHAGARQHALDQGHEPGHGESHFHVEIISEAFKPLNRLARHRAVMEVLAEEMKTVHALSLVAKAPQ